ncbi:hypothetical protein [Streptomyces minutiscleroticus]|uniref:hypothetical protein n=1 Tax=Streptomyces minutiscleroticus TaxID=68238 RepID=UPI00331ECD71
MDFSWSLTLPRTQISVLLAGRLASAAVRALGAGSTVVQDLRENLHAAGHFMVIYSRAPFFRTVMTVTGSRCQVLVTDREFVFRPASEHGGTDGRRVLQHTVMPRWFSARADTAEAGGHAEGSGVSIRFDVQLSQGESSSEAEP